MKTIVFAILMLIGCFAFGQTKEVLMLEMIEEDGKHSGIYIYREAVDPEHIPFGPHGPNRESKLLFETIAKLYKEGWETKSTMQINNYDCRFILEREKP